MNIKKLSNIFKALSNPNRLKIFLEIAKNEHMDYEDKKCDCFIHEIISNLNIGAPTISHHLKELESAGLIETERKNKYLVAKLNHEKIKEIHEFFPNKKFID